MRGYGWEPYFVEGDDPAKMHPLMAATLDRVDREIQRDPARRARSRRRRTRPRWPMIVLNTPKGWTGPKVVDGKPVEGTFRSHQVPLAEPSKNPEASQAARTWLQELPARGTVRRGRAASSRELRGARARRQPSHGRNPHANGGLLLHDLRLPDFRDYAVEVPQPGAIDAEDTRVLGHVPARRDQAESDAANFRIFGPDETLSNRLGAVFEATDRQWDAETVKTTNSSRPTAA